jgi:hypothetical protein
MPRLQFQSSYNWGWRETAQYERKWRLRGW